MSSRLPLVRLLTSFSLSLHLICTCAHSEANDVCVDYVQDLQRGHEAMLETAEYNVITKTLLLNNGSSEDARENIKQYFQDTFDLDTSLFQHIRTEFLWTRADPLRHPVCWYAAHAASFYINKLRVAGAIKQPHNKYFESTFAVGVDEMSWDDKLEDRDDWPHPDEVFRYREEVREIVLHIIDTQSLELPIGWNTIFWAVLMGIEHERIHIETSSVLIRQLPVHVFYDASELNTPFDNTCQVGEFSSTLPEPVIDDVINFKPDLGASGHAPQNELIAVKQKYVTYGRKIDDFSHKLAVYGWDNEYGEMSVEVPSFKASKYLVSNEEYYEFVLDGGYTTRSYWSDEGWRWVQSTKSKMPKFWLKKNNTFYLRNMLTEIELPWNWPVVTNHLEGLAFTRWKSVKLNTTIRMLTEDEWHVLRQLGEYGEVDQPFWDMAPGNINLEYYASECPVDMFEFGGTGFYDIIGNVWQHTLTPQHPFDGFEVHAIYDDFTVPCFGPHHNIIKGGSWISTGNVKLNTTIRMLTEDEWLVLRQLGEYGEVDQPFWEMAPGNINLEYYASECPVDMFEFGGTGFYDIIGNVWHHTLTPQHPFDGFEVHAIYDDFSVPCFGRHHNLLKGGSWISTGNEAIASSRQHFRRHFFQHAGIRYVESNRDLSYISRLAERNPFDDDGTVQLYTHFGYAPEQYLNVPNYPKYIADFVVDIVDKSNKPKGKAMDVGCATGRTVFELAKRGYEEVVGIDYTTRLIGVGYRMQENAFLEWTMTEQGQIEREYKVTAQELGFDDATLQKVSFIQNDAQNMDPRWTDFDLIVASNLIDRLLNPTLFLSHIHERCKIGGILLLCDAYSWNTKFTEQTHWIGGAVNETTQKAVYSEEAVKKLLLQQEKPSRWKLVTEKDVPLVMKESNREYRYVNTHCMILERT
eukprot:CAMPEP_0197072584 /NCGR_PEP_ID=MMETSP1384-20130603/210172_1 /TAXON_ID=29189 /ORGANISM="Ammonia sp." /LENGTH=917 /DNA_ID=CAMNT_0042511405 /DNA_START=29 /DNA_END=2782 /DNA_ORIENTATION=+